MASMARLVADLGFGDAGKGSIVDYLVRRAGTAMVVRYNGGPQAAHNVVTPDGRHHTFAQFGSGTFVSNVSTYLGPEMLINPLNVFAEAGHLHQLGVGDVWSRTVFSKEAMVITPFHIIVNQLREISRGLGRHGSCGQGIGEARAYGIANPSDSLRVGDLRDPSVMMDKLLLMQQRLRLEVEQLPNLELSDSAINDTHQLLVDPDFVGSIVEDYQHFFQMARVIEIAQFGEIAAEYDELIFEGAQGVLLDEKYGFHPYTTWSDTTYQSALDLLETIGFDGEVQRLGLIRGYATRHGAGPFVTEDEQLSAEIQEQHNGDNQWQQAFRVGYPDAVMTRYAIYAVGGVDGLVVTNLDRMVESSIGWQIADTYRLSNSSGFGNIFDTNDHDAVVGIKCQASEDLARQQSITTGLMQCRPNYQKVETPSGSGKIVTAGDVNAYLDQLEYFLQAQIVLTSSGVTASGKQLRSF